MPRISPTTEGFRVVFRRPALAIAEIAWRWSFGATVWLLLAFSCLEYLNTLPVTKADAWLLSSKKAYLVIPALRHILRGSAVRVLIAALVLSSALVLLWMFVAALGRSLTVKALLEYFAERQGAAAVRESSDATPSADRVAPELSWQLRSLMGLNFLRATLTLAAVLACLGAAILAGFASSADDPQPGVAVLLFVPLAVLIWMTWSSLNWFLSLAAVFAVRDRLDTFASISATVAFGRDRFAAVFAVSTWFGIAHLIAFVGATTAALLFLGFSEGATAPSVLAVVLTIAGFYFAVADWLYMARLAAYVCSAQLPDPGGFQRMTQAPHDGQGRNLALPSQASVDQSEPILSDMPNAAAQPES